MTGQVAKEELFALARAKGLLLYEHHLHQFLRDLMRPLWDRAHVHVRFDLRGIVYSGIEIQNWDDQPDTVEAELRAWPSQLAQLVCRVHEGLAAVRQAMSDFDRMATERAARQLRVDAELAAQHRHEESERSERTMHVLEIFIVTFYSVELAHILGESFGFGHSPMVAWTLIGVAVGTFSMATMLVMSKWLRKAGTICTVLCLFLLSSVIQGGFLTFNGWWKQQQEQLAPAAPGTAKESKAATTGHEH